MLIDYCSACFNTQPPEGGWSAQTFFPAAYFCFNTQPPEGGWRHPIGHRRRRRGFNTQPPEGDCWSWAKKSLLLFCFNTQPPEGDCGYGGVVPPVRRVSTHSRPKATAVRAVVRGMVVLFQHTAARRRLLKVMRVLWPSFEFQHTAARRRLEIE